jgi:hypothetical protein
MFVIQNLIKMKNIIKTTVFLFLMQMQGFAVTIDLSFINDTHTLLQEHVKNGKVDYASLQNSTQFKSLITAIADADLTGASDELKKAFYINAYNLLVIDQALQSYPINSVQSIAKFFDKKNITVGGNKMSLNKFEKGIIFEVFPDERLHFVLVCGALGCPPITNFAYHPDKLDAQLEKQTKLALNDNGFVSSNGNIINISQIFNWYNKDFGGDKSSIINYINKYRDADLPTGGKFNYIDYDWNINDSRGSSGFTSPAGGNNTFRYVVSSTIPKGSVEVKIFNNLYTQQTGSIDNLTDRSTFFTTTLTALYGLTDRFNVGINTRYRRVRNDIADSSPLSVLGGSDAFSSRSGVTAFGPMIRYAPVPKWENFSIQSSFVFPIGEDLTGNSDQPFIDWNGATWWTQLFNDIAIGDNFSLFTELDFLIEDIGSRDDGRLNRFSTPATLILSYNPIPNLTLYTLGSYSPFWQENFDYFAQAGVGVKYQLNPDFELELLYSDFTSQFLADTGGQAATYNFGIRFNL